MLAGTYDVVFDSAGRMTIPSRLREGFGWDVVVTPALPPDRHLLLFGESQFEQFVNQMFPATMPFGDQVRIKRLILGEAFHVKVDKAGRALVPPRLRAYAEVTGPARVVGMGGYAEIWQPEAHDRWHEQSLSDEVVGQMQSALAAMQAWQMEHSRSGT